MIPEKKLVLMVLLFLVMRPSWIFDLHVTQIYNSETLESDHTSSEI